MSILGDLLSLFQAPSPVIKSASDGTQNNATGTKKKKKHKKTTAGKIKATNSFPMAQSSSKTNMFDASTESDETVTSNHHRRGKSDDEVRQVEDDEESLNSSYVHVASDVGMKDEQKEIEEEEEEEEENSIHTVPSIVVSKAMDIATSQYLTHHMGKWQATRLSKYVIVINPVSPFVSLSIWLMFEYPMIAFCLLHLYILFVHSFCFAFFYYRGSY